MRILAGMRPLLLAVLAALITLMVPILMAPLTGDLNDEGDALTLSNPTVTLSGPSGPVTLSVELARTPEEHSTGLMNRENLSLDSGMLFIFGEDAQRSFWMHNTLIPLDMIFINSSLDVVHVEEDAQPCVASCSCRCPRYSSGSPAKYVLEANAGFAREHGIEPGQRITLNIG
jgi:uncharacterized membrane protein (UPF0127 family)